MRRQQCKGPIPWYWSQPKCNNFAKDSHKTVKSIDELNLIINDIPNIKAIQLNTDQMELAAS